MENIHAEEVDLAMARVGSAHEEQIVGGRTICGHCGWLDEADSENAVIQKWHADSFSE
jgi:hypothetical protein